ncbi:tumor necrosis factor receptor superfamily member 5 [Cololabis saira]|uniref:tumor necrosis factor receptor superfamily member 5 n=1 Tax=Cololabis saira TaxID=129043 RepID=UPI002AD4FDD8|nr:tumor necrosis factor receptor superfamily member 5 [Cololabis saira]
MTNMTCTNEKKHWSKDGVLCECCPAGKYVQADCTTTERTKCDECRRGYYTETKNYLTKCNVCKMCSSSNKQRKVADCTAVKDTVCECENGFYCSTDDCDHCLRVNDCPPGEGVLAQATRTNDTICAQCENRTYSNVTDSFSPCKAFTRCEDYGKRLKTAGTSTTDAICENLTPPCPWLLPACLWSGLVLTILIVAAVLFWKARRRSYKRSYKTANHNGPDIPAPAVTPPPELSSHCQETCTTDECKLPLFSPDDLPVICRTPDSFDSTIPIPPLKSSVSFVESSLNSEITKHCTSNLLRSFSEPQEDEWCGT